MIREYAIDLDVVVGDPETMQRFLSEFGAHKGKVIAAIPDRWLDEVNNKLREKGFTGTHKKRYMAFFEKISKSSLIKTKGTSLNGKTWIEKARELDDEFKFDAILSSSASEDGKEYDYRKMLDSAPSFWNEEQTFCCERNPVDMANAIKNALSLASKPIHFVDPYFNPISDSFRLPLLKFIEVNSLGRFKNKKAFVHTCLQTGKTALTRGDIEQGLEVHVKPILPAGYALEVVFWPNDYIHDRFVLTNNVGFAFGHGLDSPGKTILNVNINRIGEMARSKEFKKFSERANKLGEPLVIIGE